MTDLPSSMVMTPSLPTFCMASAIILPMASSPLAEMVPTWAISSLVVTTLEFFLSSCNYENRKLNNNNNNKNKKTHGNDGLDGGSDATAKIGGVDASRDVLEGLGKDGAGEDGGGGGSIAGLVVGLAGDVHHEAGAEVLELVLELDGLGDGDTVLGDLGTAVGLLNDDIAALGTEGDGDGVGELVDTLEHCLAAIVAKAHVLGSVVAARHDRGHGGRERALNRGNGAGTANNV